MQAQQEQLIDKVKAGDQGAFRELVALYRNKAFGLSYHIVGNVEDAKDILQEAFIKAYKNVGRFRKGSSFYTWFCSILVNTARDYLRKRVYQKGQLPQEIADFHLNTERLVLADELKRLLDVAINQLAEKQRLSFVMKHIDGMKINEIAQILHCRPSTVKIHLFRAVRNLQKKLSPYLTAKI